MGREECRPSNLERHSFRGGLSDRQLRRDDRRFQGALTQAAGTTLTIGGNSSTTATFSGSATLDTLAVSAGTLNISSAATITTLTQTAGTLSISGAATKNITTATISNTATTMNVSGTVTFGSLTQNAGTLTISGAATVTGNYQGSRETAKYSVLTVNANASLSIGGNLTLRNEHNNDTGARMDVSGDVSVSGNFWIARDGKGFVNIENGGTVFANTLTFGQRWADAAGTSKTSQVNVAEGGKLIAGAGGIVANADRNVYQGVTDEDILKSSALNLNGGTLGTSADSLDVDVKSGSTALSVVLGENTTSTINTGKYDTATKTFTNTGTSISIANVISGDGALKKAGAGTLTLSGNNTFEGSVTIEQGKLVAGSATAFGRGTVTAAGSTDVNEVTLKIGETGATTALTIENDISVSSRKTLILESSNDGNTLSGDLSGAGALKLSSGTLSISGSVAGESSVTALTGTTLKLTSTTAGSFKGDLTIEKDAAVSISGKETLKYSDFNAGETMSIHVGGVLDLGSKSQRISTGAKLVLAGGKINASETLASDNYGSLDFTDGDNTIVAESGESVINATIRLRDTRYAEWGGSGNLTFQVNDGARLNVAGVINPRVDTETNAGRNIIKTGAGELTLSGANTNFRGNVTIEAGTLIAANSSALGTGKVTVESGAKLGIAAGVTITKVSGGIELASDAKIVVDLSNLQNKTENFEVTLATETAIRLAAEVARVYSEDGTLNLTDYLELKGWNKSGWTPSLAYADDKLTLTMSIPEPSLFGLLAGATALGFSMSSRRRRRKA